MSRALEELDHPVFFFSLSLVFYDITYGRLVKFWDGYEKKLDIHTQLIGTFSFNWKKGINFK